MRMMRIAAVTAGLIVAGAVFGTIAGTLVLVAWGAGSNIVRFTPADLNVLLQLGIGFGGVPGAVLGPIAAWALMRHVPLGLAVGGTTLGTVVGGGMGLIATGDPWPSILYGIAGFGISALGLRIGYPRREPRRLAR